MANLQGERLARVETKIEYVGNEVRGLRADVQSFINAADSKYATKEEVERLRRWLDENNPRETQKTRLIKLQIFKEWGAHVGVLLLIVLDFVRNFK